MKVLQINSVYGTGSTGRIVSDINNLLVKEGYESYIAFGRGKAINCPKAIRIGSNYDNYTHVALTRFFDKHGFGSKRATIKFLKKIDSLDPDIIHLHNVHGYYINIELLFNYLKKANKPVVWTLHDCWAFTGHCSYFDYVGCDKWKTGCSRCPQKNKYPKSFFVDNSEKNYKLKKDLFTGLENMIIVTPSIWLKKLVQKSFLKEYPIKVIHNGINLDIFKPTISDFRKKFNLEDKFIILGVANVWEKRKGLHYFIELSKRIKSDEIIVLIGLTNEQIKQLPKNIIGLTRTQTVKELVQIYSAANVFVNTTLEDNFPTVNIESLACGTPVITFNTGGSVESIDENCGIVVEKGNINELYKAINRIKNNLIDINNCLKRAKKFDKNAKFNEYIELYKKGL